MDSTTPDRAAPAKAANATDIRSLINTFFTRLGAQDAEGVAALFAEDIDWFVPGPQALPWTGQRTRREQVPAYFRTMWSHFELAHSRAQIDKLLFDGEDAVALGRFSHVARSTGQAFSTPFAMHLTVKNGAITALHLHEDTYAVGKAFGV
ncbi:nuclear transport factor 2 family protein [Polaromonas glacialis]|uniref:nuclear transport factor 2 family protein n=1 Tax=Polaromonas glacialis TaxID=866564 RepID=UPI0006895F70|nr:nuclear transport factor 2 family protein [Polaromonas glacialis]